MRAAPALLWFLLAAPLSAAPAGLVLRDGRLLSAAGGEMTLIPRGSVVVEGGKIAAAGEAVPIREGLEVIDLAGRWVLPGFIDAHSQLGVRGESDEVALAITEDLRILDAFDPWDPEIERSLERGITSMALSPGDRNVVGGAVALVKLVPRRVPVPAVSELVALKASVSRATLGGPLFPRYPTAASGAVELLARWLGEASEKKRKPAAATGAALGSGTTSGTLTPDSPAVTTGSREPPVLVRVESRSQAERALGLLVAGGRRPILLAGRALDASGFSLLEPGCPVVLGPFDLADPPRVLRGPAVLERQGALLGFSGAGERRDLLTSAVLAMRGGLSRAAALAALTDGPARMYGLEGRLGRVAPGADADLVVWSGDPFTLAARAELVLIDGEVVYRAPALPGGSSEKRGDAEPELPRKEEERRPLPVPAAAARAAKGASSGEKDVRPILIRASRLHPVSSPSIERGEVLVRGRTIEAVGRGLTVPPGARVIDFGGEVFPGLIDCGAPLGISGSPAEEFRELTPELRALDGVDRDGRELARALEGGVTTVAVTCGDRNVIGGLGAVVKTAPGRAAGDALRTDAFLSASLTLAAVEGNMNLRSTAPYSYYHRIPTTRMGTVFLLRRAFFEALDLRLAAPESSPGESAMARLLTPSGKEALLQSLRGGRPLRLRAEERQEIESALRITAEFEAPLVLEGFTEGIDLVREVAARRCRVVIAPLREAPGPGAEGPRPALRLPELLDESGVEFAFASGSARDVASLRERLALSLKGGLSAERTLRAATLGAARILGVEAKVGSIEPGKDADLVGVRGGGPLEIRSAVDWVMVDGWIGPAHPGDSR